MANFYRFAEEAIEKAGRVGERKREHALKLAEMGEKARMAELERTQLGETRRAGLAERGVERRHLREFGPTGVRTREVGLRYAPGGAEERRLRLAYGPESPAARQAATAAGRLSEAIRKRESAKRLEEYGIETEALFEPYVEREVTETGKTREALPLWARQLYRTGKVMTLREPKRGLEFIRKEIAKRKKEEETELERLRMMPPEERKLLRERLIGETAY